MPYTTFECKEGFSQLPFCLTVEVDIKQAEWKDNGFLSGVPSGDALMMQKTSELLWAYFTAASYQ